MDDFKLFLGGDEAGSIIFATACACSALRYYIQKQKYGRLLWEDYIHLFSLVSLVAFRILYSLYTAFDTFTELDPDLSAQAGDIVWRLFAAYGAFYWTTIFASKAVFLALFRRLFWISKRFRIVWWIVTALTAAAYIAAMIGRFFICGGRADQFYYGNPACEGTVAYPYYRSTGILSLVANIGTDVFIIALPLGALSQLQMSTKRKLKIAPVFLLGLITTVVGSLTWIFEVDFEVFAEAGTKYIFIGIGIEPSITVIVTALPAILFPKANGTKGSAPQAHPRTPTLPMSQNRWLRRVVPKRRQLDDVSASVSDFGTTVDVHVDPLDRGFDRTYDRGHGYGYTRGNGDLETGLSGLSGLSGSTIVHTSMHTTSSTQGHLNGSGMDKTRQDSSASSASDDSVERHLRNGSATSATSAMSFA